jgi:outer membrane receptor for ferrienterochelin and colicins
MKKILIILIFYAISYFSSLAAEIKGKVSNLEGHPLPAVSVKIIDLKLHTSTNIRGEFSFKNISEGTYNFKLTRAGCRPIDTLIKITAGVNILEFSMNDIYRLKENIVVTGTRTAKQIETNPITTDVVTQNSIKAASRLRLDNVLSEELGMVIIEDHGKGVQIQGLDPDYALILINGEPVIGRSGGILDTRRFAMGNIKRIEVIKGPSSSLYGSNALAGVINLITDETEDLTNVRINSRYESYNTLEFGVENNLSSFNGKIYNSLYLNRLSSDGFKLSDDYYGKAVPEYTNYTLQNNFTYKFDPNTHLKVGLRFNTEDQINYFNVKKEQNIFTVDDNSKLRDLGISLSGKHQYSDLFNVESRAYYTEYRTESKYTYRTGGGLYDKYSFNQTLAKLETQWNWMLSRRHILTFGGGGNYETVEAQRLNNGKVFAHSYYAFLQEDWLASKKLNVIASLRYDWHSDYADNLSPKLAFSYNLFDGFILKGSIGSGFKAPTFQQLYLNFTNSIAGYSVFGVAFFNELFSKLVQDGIILDTIIDLRKISNLKPEKSLSFNFGFVWDVNKNIETKLNIYRNNISEMIETIPVANKNNGAQVWSYLNLSEVYTQGLETHLKVNFLNNFKLSLGYQYLEAIDVETHKDVKNGKIFMKTRDGDRRVKISEYGGLWNRSKHSANFKIEYDNRELGLNAFLRGNYRGRYGFKDKNYSNVLDQDNEYAPDYSIWNLTVTKELMYNFSMQIGCDNIFDLKKPMYLPSNPGRTFYINIIYNYSSNN